MSVYRSASLAAALVYPLLLASESSAQAAGRRFEASAISRVTFDDNVARGRAGRAGDQDVRQDDVIWSPGVAFGANLPLGRQLAFARASLSYEFFQRNDELNRERVSIETGVQGQFARCTISPTLAYSRGLSEAFDVELNALDNVSETRSASLSAACPRQNGLSPFASARRDETKNSDPRRRSVDSERDTISGGVSYNRPSIGAISLVGTRSEVRYPERPAGIPDGYDLNAIGLTYERRVSARITGRANVAYTDVQSRPGLGASDFQGVTWGLAASAQPSNTIGVDVSYDRSIQPSNRVGLDYSVTESVAASLRYTLNTRTALAAGVQRDERRFEGTPVPGGFGLSDELTSLFVSAQYQLSQRVTLSAEARHEERASDRPDFGFNSNRVSLTARARL